MLTFQEEGHIYRWDDKVVPSVSAILGPLYNGVFDKIPKAILEHKIDIGKNVHLTSEMFDKDDLDEDSLDEVTRGYFNGWKKFRDENHCEWDIIEKPMFNELHRYGGTPDRHGLVNGMPSVLDIKTVAVISKITGVQLSGYDKLLMASENISSEQRLAVQLFPNGTYELHRFTSNKDWPTFLSCLNVHSFINGR
jgi:hypothetical protein